MNDYQWLNHGQPQTLQNATILCYIDAALGLLYGAIYTPFGLLIVVGLGFGGFGVANERKWGYGVAIAAAVLQVALPVLFLGVGVLTNVFTLLQFLFDVALIALLVHPQSRSYQRIWFR